MMYNPVQIVSGMRISLKTHSSILLFEKQLQARKKDN